MTQRTGYEAFVHSVAEAGGFSPEQAEEYIVAVITTLEARLSFTEVSDLEAELPLVLRDILHGEPILDLPSMDENELFARVRARLRVSLDDARTITRIVLRELRSRISAAEAASVEAQLSPGLKALWRTSPLDAFEARPR